MALGTRPEADIDNFEEEVPADAATSRSPEEIKEPFDPREVEVITKGFTVDLLLRRLRGNELTLQPDFQRAQVWNRVAQSRLIESILIRLPLPLFYFDASDDDNWLTVDGLQRLTAIKEYVVDEAYALQDLEFLHTFDGLHFSDLPRPFQRRIEEAEIQVSLIQAGTPDDVKFNLFKRINTGGMPLSPQEIRHALNQGPITRLLAELAGSAEFRQATAGGVAPRRMGDRELALRFLAFTREGYEGYNTQDLDVFLHAAMRSLNEASKRELGALERRFLKSMVLAHELLGKHAFRKAYRVDQEWRSPVNKALFDAWSVGLGSLSDTQATKARRRAKRVWSTYVELNNEPAFFDAISQGTGQPAKIILRLRRVQEALEGIVR